MIRTRRDELLAAMTSTWLDSTEAFALHTDHSKLFCFPEWLAGLVQAEYDWVVPRWLDFIMLSAEMLDEAAA